MNDEIESLPGEEWRQIPGYEGRFEVSSKGRYKSVSRFFTKKNGLGHTVRGRILIPWINPQTGYPRYTLSKCGKTVSREGHYWVMLAFIGPLPAGLQCRHLNGIKTDNRLENLAYGTPLENQRDRFLHGTNMCGEKSPASKLKECEVREILSMLESGERQDFIAEKFRVTQSLVSRIKRKIAWAHLHVEASV
jgi:hypothetical protein